MGRLEGKVKSITAAGDLVTDIALADLGNAPTDDQLTVECEGHKTFGLYPPQHEQPEMTFLAIQNETGFVQISIVGGSASQFLGIPVDAVVTVTW